MPGSSLWLLPPDDHPLQDALTTLIKQTSAHFKSPHLFIPHITLTSEISPEMYGEDPQAWLDSLPIVSKRELSIRFEKIDSEDVFFRKLYIKCEKLGGLEKLAKVCRKQVRGFEDDAKAVEWVKNVYNPHLSLL